MKDRHSTLKGYFFALIYVLALSNVYIFSKAALKEVHIAQFGVYWFGLGLIWNLIFATKTCKKETIINLTRSKFFILGIIGLLEIVATTSFFTAIHIVENPAVVSFLGNIGPMFVITLGLIFLKERFNFLELIGIVFILTGAFVISYTGNSNISEIFIKGTEYAILASLIFSIITIVVKKNILTLPPALQALNRTFFLFVFSFIMFLMLKQSLFISWKAFYNIAIGSVLGPFLTVVANYNAMRYIGAGRVSIFGSIKSLFVVAGAFIYFGILPHNYQLAGGLLTIFGVALITGVKFLRNKRKESV